MKQQKVTDSQQYNQQIQQQQNQIRSSTSQKLQDVLNSILQMEDQQSSLQKLITEPEQLKMLILAATQILIQDMPTLMLCTNLIKLDISSNTIKQFPKDLSFAPLQKLKLLYLHNNLIDDFEPLEKLFILPNLIYLTIFSNPIASKSGVRHYIVNSLKPLYALDFNVIADEERTKLVMSTEKYYSMSVNTKISWPLVVYPSDQVLTDDDYLQLMQEEIKIITNKFYKNSPILIIQKNYRRYLMRKRVFCVHSLAKDKTRYIKFVIEKWKRFRIKRLYLKATLAERNMTMDTKSFLMRKTLDRIKQIAQKFRLQVQERKKQQRAFIILLKYFVKSKHQMTNYYQLLDVTISSRYYFRKDQLRIFEGIIQKTYQYIENQYKFYQYQLQNMNNDELNENVKEIKKQSYEKKIQESHLLLQQMLQIKDNLYDYIKPAGHCITLRVPEVKKSIYSTISYLSFIRPSLQSQVLLLSTERSFYKPYELPFFKQMREIVTIPDKRTKKFKLSEKEKEKVNITLDQLEAFHIKQYEQFMLFTLENEQIRKVFMKQVLVNNIFSDRGTTEVLDKKFITQPDTNFSKKDKKQQITNYNQDSQQIQASQQQLYYPQLFMIFFEKELFAVSSALKLQKIWRMKKILKVKQFISPFRKIQEIRATRIIQRWFRVLPISHRANFIKEIYFYLQNIQHTSSLNLHYDIYQQLTRIVNEQQHNYKSFKFLEQNCLIAFDPIEKRCHLQWDTRTPFFQLIEQKGIQLFPSSIGYLSKIQCQPVKLWGDIMHLLHVGSQAKVHMFQGMKFVTLDFQSPLDAQYRAFALALLTYRLVCNGNYIKMFTHKQLQDYQLLLPYEQLITAVYDIELPHDSSLAQKFSVSKINNPNCLFICSQIPIDFINKQIKVCNNFGTVDVTMFAKQSMNQRPKKLFANILYFYNSNIYSIKEEIIVQQNYQKKNESEPTQGRDQSFISQESNRFLTEIPQTQNLRTQSTPKRSNMSILNTENYQVQNPLNLTIISLVPMFGQEGEQQQQQLLQKSSQKSQQVKYQSIAEQAQKIRCASLQEKNEIREFIRERKISEMEQKKNNLQDLHLKIANQKEKNQEQKLLKIEQIQKNNQLEKEKNYKLGQELQEKDQLNKLQKIQLIKRVAASKFKNDQEFFNDFSRNQNFIIKQHAIFSSKKTVQNIEINNSIKAQKIREQRLNVSISSVTATGNIGGGQRLNANQDQQNSAPDKLRSISHKNSKQAYSSLSYHYKPTYNKREIATSNSRKQDSITIQNISLNTNSILNQDENGHIQLNKTYDYNQQDDLNYSGFKKISDPNNIQQQQQYKQIINQQSIDMDKAQNFVDNEQIVFQNQIKDRPITGQEKRKKISKMSDKIPHAAFPEEFYPIAGNKQQFFFNQQN